MRSYEHLEHEIARKRFQQYTLTTDSIEYKLLDLEILDLLGLQDKCCGNNQDATD